MDSSSDHAAQNAAETSLDVPADLAGQNIEDHGLSAPALDQQTQRRPASRALIECERVLNTVFGYSQWRGKQMEIVEAAVRRSDVLVIAPTGMGKSLCFQIPAIADKRGVSIVVSPLLALMKNQVTRLKQLNVPAHSWTSETSYDERKELENDLKSDHPRTRLIYVAPEGLLQDRFRNMLQALYRQGELNRFVIDEAHCIVTWGQEFREDYMKLGSLRQRFRDIPIMALTASATPKMCDEIVRNLRLDHDNLFRVVHPFNRSNLFYEVRYVAQPATSAQMDQVAEYILSLHARRGCPSSGMVYCRKRETCDALAELLRKKAINARPYHKGIASGTLDKTLRQWEDTMNGVNDKGSGGSVDVVCSTVACGMGIDKGDIRYVIHFDMPKSFEGYYQETGRAGRDGQASKCILYYSREDAIRVRKLQSLGREQRVAKVSLNGGKDPDKQARKSLKALLKFIEGTTVCRHVAICRYFGEKVDLSDAKVREAYCQKMCDICKYPEKTASKRAELSDRAQICTQLVTMEDVSSESESEDDAPPRAAMRKPVQIQPPAVVQNRYYPSAHGVPKRTLSDEGDAETGESEAKRPRMSYQQPVAGIRTTATAPGTIVRGMSSTFSSRKAFKPPLLGTSGAISSSTTSSSSSAAPQPASPPRPARPTRAPLYPSGRDDPPDAGLLDGAPPRVDEGGLSRLLRQLDNEPDLPQRSKGPKEGRSIPSESQEPLKRTGSASSTASLSMDGEAYSDVPLEVHDKCSLKVPIDKRLEAVERLYNALRKALRNAELAERVSIGCVDKSERPKVLANAAKELELDILCFCSSATGYASGQVRMVHAVQLLGQARATWADDADAVRNAENALAIVQREVGNAV